MALSDHVDDFRTLCQNAELFIEDLKQNPHELSQSLAKIKSEIVNFRTQLLALVQGVQNKDEQKAILDAIDKARDTIDSRKEIDTTIPPCLEGETRKAFIGLIRLFLKLRATLRSNEIWQDPNITSISTADTTEGMHEDTLSHNDAESIH